MPFAASESKTQGFTSRPTESNMRWFVCFLLFLATTINYMDRSVLSLIEPLLHVSFMGWIPGRGCEVSGWLPPELWAHRGVLPGGVRGGVPGGGAVHRQAGYEDWICGCDWDLGGFVAEPFAGAFGAGVLHCARVPGIG